jgi:hypothetical protein
MKQFVAIAIALAALIGQASAQDRIEGAALAGPSVTTDPQVQIYRFTGVRDNGGTISTGIATSFHCTNFSGATEALRIQIRGFDGVVKADATFNLTHNRTFTMSTHGTTLYIEDAFLLANPTAIDQGSARIWATSTAVVCTAQVVDAAATVPTGIDLHGIRFNPIAGTLE